MLNDPNIYIYIWIRKSTFDSPRYVDSWQSLSKDVFFYGKLPVSVGFPTHVSIIYTNSAIINQLHQQSSTINPSKSHLYVSHFNPSPVTLLKKHVGFYSIWTSTGHQRRAPATLARRRGVARAPASVPPQSSPPRRPWTSASSHGQVAGSPEKSGRWWDIPHLYVAYTLLIMDIF